MVHKNPSQRKGWLFTQKWNNEYFARIGLIPGNWLYFNKMWGYELETYIERQKERAKKKLNSKIANKLKRGQEYYTPARLNAIKAAQAYS